MTVFAAIDVGSNAIRLAVATQLPNRELKTILSQRSAVRLGEDVFVTGTIAPNTITRAVQAFRGFKEALRHYDVEVLRAVGTSALREARNSEEFISAIKEASGIEITTIEGEEEARLVCLAVQTTIDLSQKTALLIEIGGGSVEVTLMERGVIVLSDTAKPGAVRLLHLLNGSEPAPSREAISTFHTLLDEYCAQLGRRVKREIGNRVVDIVIGTGGNIETLGDLKKSVLGGASDNEISMEEIGNLVAKLEACTVPERIVKFGMKPDRADVIVPAAVVVLNVLKESMTTKLLIPKVGLRDGIMLDAALAYGDREREYYSHQTLAFARELVRKYGADSEHAETVKRNAERVFDSLKELGSLAFEHRLIVEAAAVLHEIGQFVCMDGYHKHSAYLIRSTPFVGILASEKDLLVAVVRYHRRSLPKESHPEYAQLSKGDRASLGKLVCVIRLAETLAGHERNRLRDFDMHLHKNKLRLTLEGHGELMMERWMLTQLAPYFQRIFGLDLEVVKV